MGGKARILVASRNAGKVREIAAVLGGLGVELVALDEADPDRQIAEPPETGETFAANSRAKAEYYARATGQWALADVLGVTQQTISKKLRGETAILVSDLEKLARHYKIHMTYFFEGWRP